jgi:hypothetical protein
MLAKDSMCPLPSVCWRHSQPPTPTVSTDTKLWMGDVEPAVSVAIDSVVGSQVGQAAVNARPEAELAVLRTAKDASARAEAYF